MKCKYCENNRYFEMTDSDKICLNCGAMERLFITGTSLMDCSRINMKKKPVYDQVSYFEKCMSQYQGKQNTRIPDKLLVDLENKFRDGSTSEVCVTRDKIIKFLKELQYKKQSKNVNLIYSELTQKRFDDISHLEYALVRDFEYFLDLYKEYAWSSLNRKNFLNIPSLLFQLLRHRGHPCKMSNFNVLKTSNSIKIHNDITRNLFEKLGWKFTPIESIK